MPKLRAVTLTEKKVRAARAEPGRRLELWDAQAPGLCLRISQTGARSWVVRCRTGDGRQPRITLGPVGPAVNGLSLTEARDRAHDVRRQARFEQASSGTRNRETESPERASIQSEAGFPNRFAGHHAPASGEAPTVLEAWLRFRTSHLERKKRSLSTIRGYADHMERLFADWHGRSLMEFGENPRLLSDRHDLISARNGPTIANGAMRSFRAVYNHARKTCRALPPDNPASAVDWNPEERKDTAMGMADLPDWLAQLVAIENPIRREFHLLTLLSGSRPEALKNVRVKDVDLAGRTMHVARPKGGEMKAFDIPLSKAMMRSVLRLLRIGPVMFPRSGREWLFPSDAPSGHMSEHGEDRCVLSHWGNDLRQTYRTLAQAAEVSEVDVHLLMNHSLRGVNAGYITRSKLTKDHLRAQQEKLSSFILGGAVRRGSRDHPGVRQWLASSGRKTLAELLAQDPDVVRARTGSRAAVRKLEVQAARITSRALPVPLIEAPSRRTRAGREALLVRDRSAYPD